METTKTVPPAKFSFVGDSPHAFDALEVPSNITQVTKKKKSTDRNLLGADRSQRTLVNKTSHRWVVKSNRYRRSTFVKISTNDPEISLKTKQKINK